MRDLLEVTFGIMMVFLVVFSGVFIGGLMVCLSVLVLATVASLVELFACAPWAMGYMMDSDTMRYIGVIWFLVVHTSLLVSFVIVAVSKIKKGLKQ